MNAEQRSRAGRAVADRIAEMNAATTTVTRAAGVSPKTLRSLMHGDRSPTNTVQATIEAVLRRRPGESPLTRSVCTMAAAPSSTR
jgi:hypothetical protein